jgi:hypothetical protein
MKFYTTLVCFILFCGLANAQLEKNIHSTFRVDSIESLTLNLSGDIKIEKWAGNMILAETNVKLYDAGGNVLKYFIEKGRYDLALTTEGSEGELASIDLRRAPIRTKNGECYEIVSIKLLVPEEFEVTADNKLTRPIKVEEPIEKNDSTKIAPIQLDFIKIDSLKVDTLKIEEPINN